MATTQKSKKKDATSSPDNAKATPKGSTLSPTPEASPTKEKKALAFPKFAPPATSGGYVGAQGNPERGDRLIDERRYVPHSTLKGHYIGRVENRTNAGTFRAIVFDKPYDMVDLQKGRQKQDIKVPPAIRKSRSDARFYVEHNWASRHSEKEA